MLPPGISFNALSPRALEAAKTREAAALVLGLGRDRRDEQGRLLAVHAEHQPAVRPGRSRSTCCSSEGLRQGVRAPPALGARACAPRCSAWGLPIQCADPAVYSPVLTGVITPAGVDADAVRRLIYERFDLSLGTGLGKVKGRMFRIGHLGDSNDLTLLATLAGVRDGAEARRRASSPAAACRPRWITSPAHPRRRAALRAGGLNAHARRLPRPTETDSHATTFPHPGRRRRGRHARRAARCSRRNGRTGRCASSSAFRRAAAPTRWRAWSAPS